MLLISPTKPLDAFKEAAKRGVLPTELGSAGVRREFTQAMREGAVFSARTNSAEYLQRLRVVINQLTQGDIDLATARLILKQTLATMGYTPEGGFPDEAAVPPAVVATLTDLSSTRRTELVLKTQEALMRSAGQKTRGMTQQRLRQFPAWELVRIGSRLEPRSWQQRFTQAGGEVKGGRMIAMKGDDVWDELGSKSNFDDALDVDSPPFAYNSGMAWREVDAETVRRLGITGPDGETVDSVLDALPKPKASTSGIDPDFANKLKADLKAEENANGELTIEQILQGGQS